MQHRPWRIWRDDDYVEKGVRSEGREKGEKGDTGCGVDRMT